MQNFRRISSLPCKNDVIQCAVALARGAVAGDIDGIHGKTFPAQNIRNDLSRKIHVGYGDNPFAQPHGLIIKFLRIGAG